MLGLKYIGGGERENLKSSNVCRQSPERQYKPEALELLKPLMILKGEKSRIEPKGIDLYRVSVLSMEWKDEKEKKERERFKRPP